MEEKEIEKVENAELEIKQPEVVDTPTEEKKNDEFNVNQNFTPNPSPLSPMMSKIHLLPSGQRFFAFLLDAVICVFLSIPLSLAFRDLIYVPYAEKQGLYNEETLTELQEQVSKEEELSYLFLNNPNYSEGNEYTAKFVYLNDDSVEEKYKNYLTTDTKEINESSVYYNIYKFFTDYLCSDKPVFADENYTSKVDVNHKAYWYNVFVLGLNDELGLYNVEDLDARPDFIKNCSLFAFGEDKNEMANVRSDLLTSEGALTSEGKEKLRDYFFDNKEVDTFVAKYSYKSEQLSEEMQYLTNVYQYVTSYWIYLSHDTTKDNSLITLLLDYQNMSISKEKFYMSYPEYTALATTIVIFYVIFPLILKKGRTIGKFVLKGKLIDKNEKDVHWYHLILRTVLPVAVVLIMMVLCANISLISAILIGLLILLIAYLFMIFSRKTRAIHDFIAGTTVIMDDDR